MNERLYASLGAMPDAERKRDRGAFFGSIHRTLNHLVWADSIWLSRFTRGTYAAPAYGADLVADFDVLARERESLDMRMLDWAGRIDPDWLAATLEYRSAGDGRVRQLAGWVAAAHLFNHATHHRGQLSTLMKQAGLDPGVTDLPFLPGVARIID